MSTTVFKNFTVNSFQEFTILHIFRNVILLILLITSPTLLGQSKSYDDVLYQTIVKTAGSDINLAMHMADSLYRRSEEPLHKVKSLMLLAELNLTTGNKKQGLNYAFMAEQITSDNNLYEWNARIFGFIASHYRSLGLKKQSKIYLRKGLAVIENVEDKHIANQYKGLAYQELALFEVESKNYVKAIDYFKKAEPCFKYVRNKEIRLYQLATNYGQLGRVMIELDQTESSRSYFKKALQLLSLIKNEATVVKGFMYEGMGRSYLEENEFKKALPHLTQALTIAANSNDLSLKEEIYCDMTIYYMETGDKINLKKYNALYQAVREKSLAVNKDSSEVVVDRLEEKQKQISLQRNYIFGALAITALILLWLVFYYRRRRKAEYRRFKEIIKNMREQRLSPKSEQTVKITVSDIALEAPEKELMPKDVEQSILAKLQQFEQGDDFTSKTINLAGLAVKFETNTKYLSHVINKHKRKDFSNYINELRIFYIIRKLESVPEYLNYKISYLAEHAGFSSHSKFTDKFKAVTGMSPSSFIEFLRKEK